MKTFRIFRDIKAKDYENALQKLSDEVDFPMPVLPEDIFRVQEDPFTDEEEAAILKIAHISLRLGDWDYIGEELDLNDNELKKLQNKIDAVINR